MYRIIAILIAIVASFAAGWFVNHQWPGLLSGEADEQPVVSEQGSFVATSRIVAQGKLRPRGGILNVMATPGQRVAEVLVKESDKVESGETILLRLESEELLELQSDLAAARKTETELQLAQSRMSADAAVRSSNAALQSAQMKLVQLESSADLKIAEKELAAATQRLADLKELSQDPLTQTLVSAAELNQQQVQLESRKLKLDDARQQHELALAAATESVEQSRLGLDQAQNLAELAGKAESENRSAALAQLIAETQLKQNRIVSPINGTVLRVLTKPGETVTTMPLLQIGDLSGMECVAEVSELFAGELVTGMSAVIRSPSLPSELKGTVTAVGKIVGSAALPEPNPLALVDRKTIEVHIAIAELDTVAAHDFSNLQVTVEILSKQ